MLAKSSDPVDREILRTLRAWQDANAARGAERRLGREPGQIQKIGSIAVIEGRILSRAAGFDEVDPNESYEAIVEKYPERFAANVRDKAIHRLANARKKL